MNGEPTAGTPASDGSGQPDDVDVQDIVLPTFTIPVVPWLFGPAGAALGVGALGLAVGYASQWYAGTDALYGSVATALAVFLAAVATRPWRPRDAQAWMPWVMGAQGISILLLLIGAPVIWRATGAGVGPLGFTAVLGFLAAEGVRAVVYSGAAQRARSGS